MPDQFFAIHNLTKEFGGIHALKSLDIIVNQGEIHAVIGPNGAGKTTLINVVSGLEKPSTGEIFFRGERIDRLPPEKVFERGISRTFQEGKIIPGLTVLENVMIGINKRKEGNGLKKRNLARYFNWFNREIDIKKIGQDILKIFELQEIEDRWADDLVWFERQLVQIARSIASKPKFLLLDEPTAGLDTIEKEIIEKRLIGINQSGVTIVFVSHDIQFIRRIAQRITVLDFGQKICEGLSTKVLSDPRVLEAYFGAE